MTRLEAYRKLKGLTLAQLGAAIGRTQPQAGRYCKPRSAPGHNVPQWRVGETIKKLTHGVIDLGNYADEIEADEAALMIAEIERRAAAAGARS
jgi:transcriptional regulator with XRE-family HTH domain